MNTAIVSFGSNIKPKFHFKKAKSFLTQKFKLLKTSKPIYTQPLGEADQPDFLNAVFLIETNLLLKEFKQELKGIEISLGRKTSASKFAPREVDLDIIIWNNKVIHQDFYERDFLRGLVAQIGLSIEKNLRLKSL